MKKNIFTISTTIIAVVFWLFDAIVHYFIYKEPEFELVPDDFNELWMRLVIIILLISIGVLADNFSKKMLIAQKKLEAARIYDSMIYASHHIVNNLLNQMQLFKLEAKRSKDFDPKIISYFETTIDEASDLIEKLSHIENITEKDILASIDPNNKKQSEIERNKTS